MEVKERIRASTRNDTLALRFVAELGMTNGEIGKIIDMDADHVDRIIHGAPVETHGQSRNSLDQLIELQSLLLSGYTPSSAIAWHHKPQMILDGRTPISIMVEAGSHAIADVLKAARVWMSR